MCFLEKGSLAGKLASKKYDIIIAQALSKLREYIDVLKLYYDFLWVPGRCHKLYLLIKVSSVLRLNPTDALRFLTTLRNAKLSINNFLINGSAGTWVSNPVLLIRHRDSASVQPCTVFYQIGLQKLNCRVEMETTGKVTACPKKLILFLSLPNRFRRKPKIIMYD